MSISFLLNCLAPHFYSLIFKKWGHYQLIGTYLPHCYNNTLPGWSVFTAGAFKRGEEWSVYLLGRSGRSFSTQLSNFVSGPVG